MVARGRPAKARGVRWERAVAQYLGSRTTRSVAPGVHEDRGDVVWPGHVIECKDHSRWGRYELMQWFEQTERKAGDDDVPVLVIKRPQMPTSHGLVIVRLGNWID